MALFQIVKFVKAHTNGNDFVIINQTATTVDGELIKKIADRNFGIGCDQIVFVRARLNDARYTVGFANQDGTTADMCGNGACATAIYIRNKLGNKATEIVLEIAGIAYKALIKGEEVTVRFPLPQVHSNELVVTGNHHAVLGIEEIAKIDDLLAKYANCNIHFYRILDHGAIAIKTFERGVGWTKACGSGAVAVACKLDLWTRTVVIHEGGESVVEIGDEYVDFTATPRLVFDGVWYG
jgi:diaminopimelate epimerase